MKKIITLIIVSFLLASCGSESGNTIAQNTTSTSRTVPFRAHYTWVSTTTYNRYVKDNIEIVYADSAYRAGDTVELDSKEYILEEKVK